MGSIIDKISLATEMKKTFAVSCKLAGTLLGLDFSIQYHQICWQIFASLSGLFLDQAKEGWIFCSVNHVFPDLTLPRPQKRL